MGGSLTTRRNAGPGSVTSDCLQNAAFMMASNPEFREVFVSYVLKADWIHSFFTESPNIFLFGETNEMSYLLPDQYIYSPGDETVKLSFDDDLIRRSSRSESLDHTYKFYASRLTSIFTSNQKAMIPLLLAAAYPSFLKSTEFHEWLRLQKNPSVFEQSLLQRHFRSRSSSENEEFQHSTMIPGDVHFIAKRSQSKWMSSRSTKTDYLRLKQFLHECVSPSIHSNIREEIDSLLVFPHPFCSWLPSIKSLLDKMPAAISIACVHPHPQTRETFPLIYVNKAFEDMTQYSSAEVLGRNCRFLQGEATVEMNQVCKMREALQTINPIKLTVSNVRKDGTRFYNFLALRPVFNTANEYSYVLGIHYEVSAYDFHRFFNEHRSFCTLQNKLQQLHEQQVSDSGVNCRTSVSTICDDDVFSSERATVSADLGNFARDFQYIEDLLNLIPSILY